MFACPELLKRQTLCDSKRSNCFGIVRTLAEKWPTLTWRDGNCILLNGKHTKRAFSSGRTSNRRAAGDDLRCYQLTSSQSGIWSGQVEADRSTLVLAERGRFSSSSESEQILKGISIIIRHTSLCLNEFSYLSLISALKTTAKETRKVLQTSPLRHQQISVTFSTSININFP